MLMDPVLIRLVQIITAAVTPWVQQSCHTQKSTPTTWHPLCSLQSLCPLFCDVPSALEAVVQVSHLGLNIPQSLIFSTLTSHEPLQHLLPAARRSLLDQSRQQHKHKYNLIDTLYPVSKTTAVSFPARPMASPVVRFWPVQNHFSMLRMCSTPTICRSLLSYPAQ